MAPAPTADTRSQVASVLVFSPGSNYVFKTFGVPGTVLGTASATVMGTQGPCPPKGGVGTLSVPETC